MPKKLTIHITSASGRGPTLLSAFDNALELAQIANYNLIPLSSVIPEGAEVIDKKPQIITGGHGDRLYVVLAQKSTEVSGEVIAAGLGWATMIDGSGRGLFVEHTGSYEEIVSTLIEKSLTDMIARRGGQYDVIQKKIISNVCDGEPLCVLVSAVFTSEPW